MALKFQLSDTSDHSINSRAFTDHLRPTIKAQPAVESNALRLRKARGRSRPKADRTDIAKRTGDAERLTRWPLRPGPLQPGHGAAI